MSRNKVIEELHIDAGSSSASVAKNSFEARRLRRRRASRRSCRVIQVATGAILLVGGVVVTAAGTPPNPPAAQLPTSTPLTDPLSHDLAYTERFMMLGVEYCAPRIKTLDINRSTAGGPAHSAYASFNAETLATFDPSPWKKGQANPEWGKRVMVRVVASRPDWGFPAVFQLRIGKPLSETPDSALISPEEMRQAVAVDRQSPTQKLEHYYLVRLSGQAAIAGWRRNGSIEVTYGLTPGIVGSFTAEDGYLDRLEILNDVARRIFRPCTERQ